MKSICEQRFSLAALVLNCGKRFNYAGLVVFRVFGKLTGDYGNNLFSMCHFRALATLVPQPKTAFQTPKD